MQHYVTLYVPIQSLELYRNASLWKWIDNIVGVAFSYADVNGDGEINIADVNSGINAIMEGGSLVDDIYDVNGDGEVNIADINAIINEIIDH